MESTQSLSSGFARSSGSEMRGRCIRRLGEAQKRCWKVVHSSQKNIPENYFSFDNLLQFASYHELNVFRKFRREFKDMGKIILPEKSPQIRGISEMENALTKL